MAEIGVFNSLCVIKQRQQGLYLDGGDLGEILLPKKYVKEKYKTGDWVDVFVHLDSEDRLIATTQEPYGEVGDFACLEVVAVEKIGAFLDWGLPKDLFVPTREQRFKMKKGESYVVYIYLDPRTERIVASSQLSKFVEETSNDFAEGDKVFFLLAERTELGYKAIVEGSCWGLVYVNEIFQEVELGDIIEGYVKKVRDDGKLDLSLYPSGFQKIEGFSQFILERLKEEGGFLPLHDKSDPDRIRDELQMSKKNFKKAIGGLFKSRHIRIEKTGIRLVSKD